MKKMRDIVIAWRVPIIIITLALTLFFGLGITRLSINSDITSYLKPDDPAMVLFNRIGEEYGGNHTVMVAVHSQDIISYPTLKLVGDLTEKYKTIQGVSTVTSLLNIIDIRDSGWGIEVGLLIDENKIPESKKELEELRDYIFSQDIYPGKIISPDGTTTLIICRLDPDHNKVETAKLIQEVTEQMRGEIEVYYSGYPVQVAEISNFLSRDLKTLIPIVLVIILLVLYFSFRTMRGVLLPLTVVVISTIWTMGLMGYTKTPLSIISNIIPVILLALGTAYGIHFLARYYEDITTEDRKVENLKKTVHHISIPIFLAAVTTVAGFLSFSGAYITAISEFGLFTAFGVVVAMGLSLTFLPSVLSFMKVKAGALSGGKSHLFKGIMRWIAEFVIRKRKYILIVCLIIGGISCSVIPGIKLETALTNFFPHKSDIRQANKVIKENFGGSTTLQIVVKGDFKNPFVLKKVYKMQKFLEHLDHTQNTQSLADLIARMNDIINNHKNIPHTNQEIANLMFLLEGNEILEQLVNRDYTEGLIHATFGSEKSKLIDKTIEQINSYLKQNLNGKYIVVSKDLLPEEEKTSIHDFILDDISHCIYYDLSLFDADKATDPEKIKNALSEIISATFPLIGGTEKQNLIQNLNIFFQEESEIIMDNESEIKKVVDGIVKLSMEIKPSIKDIELSLRELIPEKYWKNNPGSIEWTSEFVQTKIENAQNNYWISRIKDQLIKKLFPQQKTDEMLDKKIQNELWSLTEKSVAVPADFFNPGVISNQLYTTGSFTMNSELTGMLKITQRLNQSLIKSQIQSLVIAIIVVFGLLVLQFKSVKLGAVALSPIVLVILINFGLMGLTSIPLDYATMLVGSILIGVGIDYSIHFTTRLRKEFSRQGSDMEKLEKTLKTTGVAIVSNALMVALGFFVLICGTLVPVRREGWMIGVLMLISAFAALVFLPALIFSINKKTILIMDKNDT